MVKEVVIKHGKIDIVIPFDTVDDLKTKLQDHDDILNVLKQNLGEYLKDSKVIRKDLEGVCDFQDGYVVLLKPQTESVKKVSLVLYAYGPQGATLEEISISSGIQNPSKRVLTNGSSKKYFRKLATGNYALSEDGLNFVVRKVIPELKGVVSDATG